MGSLASLSPLEALGLLSETIPKSIDIKTDSFSFSGSKILFRGSVPDNPSVGKLSGVLENRSDKICSVVVDPKGKIPGSNRIKYNAEITLCE